MAQWLRKIKNVSMSAAEYDAVLGMDPNMTTHEYDLPYRIPPTFHTDIYVWGRMRRLPYVFMAAEPLSLANYLIVWRQLFKRYINAVDWRCYGELLEACKKCHKQWLSRFWSKLSDMGKEIL